VVEAGLPPLFTAEFGGALNAALEDLQGVFYYLALANTRRVSRLASSPDSLAVWALEILRDTAEAALKFVQVKINGGVVSGG
jgi:hypothetical protein